MDAVTDISTSRTVDTSATEHVQKFSKERPVPGGRAVWVENAKALGIVLVVYGHVARGADGAGLFLDEHQFQLLDSIIYSFHMPLFFFLSGLFFRNSLEKRGWRQFCANKMDTLLYPYLVWSLLQGGVEILFSDWTNGHATVSRVAELLWYPRAQLWFLYALLAITLLAACLWKILGGLRSGLVTLIAALAFLIKDHDLGIPALTYVLNYSVFFALGAYFNDSALAGFFFRRRRSLLLPCMALFIAGQFLFHFTFGYMYRTGGGAELALAIVSIAALVPICMCLADSRVAALEKLGAASLAIYLVHISVASGSRIAIMRMFHIADLPLILSVGTILGVVVPMAIYAKADMLRIRFLFEVPASLSVENVVESRRGRIGPG